MFRDNHDYEFQPMTPSSTAVDHDKQHNKWHASTRRARGYEYFAIGLACAFMLGIGWSMGSHTAPHQSSVIVKRSSSLVSTPPVATDEFAHDGPKIAWLMSFPNSGTSYTSKLVRHLSRKSTASNYGEEYMVKGNSLLVFNKTNAGPFWIDPMDEAVKDSFSRPTNWVLTKTHCGGRCEKCGPKKYIETPHSFLKRCVSGHRAITQGGGKTNMVETFYPPEWVQKAVHLIRNPFDNVVSRFHLEHHHEIHLNQTDKLAKYPSSREGFRAFCFYLNDKYAAESSASRLVDKEAFELLEKVPCHLDFFRYVQWHNLAFTMTQTLKIPSLALHYELFESNFDETVTELMDFLELERKGDLLEFIKGKEYLDYFTAEEKLAVKASVQLLALPITWEHIQHYFEDF